MGPHETEEYRQLKLAIAAYRRINPLVIIKEPGETRSGLWEVSLPSAATMAFDDPASMLSALMAATITAEP